MLTIYFVDPMGDALIKVEIPSCYEKLIINNDLVH